MVIVVIIYFGKIQTLFPIDLILIYKLITLFGIGAEFILKKPTNRKHSNIKQINFLSHVTKQKQKTITCHLSRKIHKTCFFILCVVCSKS